MASIPEKHPIGGVWPLGVITVVAGNPVPITQNVGAQGQQQLGGGRAFTANCRQLVFSTAGNTGVVYVSDQPGGGFGGYDVNRTLLAIAPNMVVSLPNGATTVTGEMDITRYYIDGATSGDKVTVAAVDAS